jgi:hypothetical protein
MESNCEVSLYSVCRDDLKNHITMLTSTTNLYAWAAVSLRVDEQKAVELCLRLQALFEADS